MIQIIAAIAIFSTIWAIAHLVIRAILYAVLVVNLNNWRAYIHSIGLLWLGYAGFWAWLMFELAEPLSMLPAFLAFMCLIIGGRTERLL